jgi:hypothetical protein
MIEEARLIAYMAGSGEVSDEDLAILSEEFFENWGCHWTEILN